MRIWRDRNAVDWALLYFDVKSLQDLSSFFFHFLGQINTVYTLINSRKLLGILQIYSLPLHITFTLIDIKSIFSQERL